MEIAHQFSANLPSFAIPLFLRICPRLERTGTFKLKKGDLQREGFSLEKCGPGQLFTWNKSLGQYVEVDEEKYGQLKGIN